MADQSSKDKKVPPPKSPKLGAAFENIRRTAVEPIAPNLTESQASSSQPESSESADVDMPLTEAAGEPTSVPAQQTEPQLQSSSIPGNAGRSDVASEPMETAADVISPLDLPATVRAIRAMDSAETAAGAIAPLDILSSPRRIARASAEKAKGLVKGILSPIRDKSRIRKPSTDSMKNCPGLEVRKKDRMDKSLVRSSSGYGLKPYVDLVLGKGEEPVGVDPNLVVQRKLLIYPDPIFGEKDAHPSTSSSQCPPTESSNMSIDEGDDNVFGNPGEEASEEANEEVPDESSKQVPDESNE